MKGALGVVLASLLLSLAIALAFPLVDPDEGRNAEVAREMAASGDVVVPHLAGVPYLDKPPALFAAAAPFIRLFGPVPLAARMPAILASLATLLVLVHAAARAGPGERLPLAPALAAAAPLYAVMSAYVIFDMPLTLCVTVVWTALARGAERALSSRGRLGLFLAIAAGVLVKGPVMLAWVIGGALGAALFTRSWAPLRPLGWLPGWLLMLLVAGGWFALALRRHPEYLRYAFVEESLERMTSGSFRREQPVWFAPAVLVGGALPWSLATPWRLPRSPSARVAAGFVLFALVFFTFSRSKLVTYLLPAVPAMAWWAAEGWRASRRPAWSLAAVLAFTPLVLLAGGPTLLRTAGGASGEALARAIRANGNGTVRYEDCYSPGTDYLLGRTSVVVSALGSPLTSNYAVRYRELLRTRGQWTLVASPEVAPPADVVVRETRRAGTPPAGSREIFRSRRFIAWRSTDAARP